MATILNVDDNAANRYVKSRVLRAGRASRCSRPRPARARSAARPRAGRTSCCSTSTCPTSAASRSAAGCAQRPAHAAHPDHPHLGDLRHAAGRGHQPECRRRHLPRRAGRARGAVKRRRAHAAPAAHDGAGPRRQRRAHAPRHRRRRHRDLGDRRRHGRRGLEPAVLRHARLRLAAGRRRRSRAWLERVHPSERAALAAALQQARTAGGAPSTHEHRDRAPRTTAMPLPGAVRQAACRRSADAARLIGVVTDVTERRRAETRARSAARAGARRAARGRSRRCA